MIDTDDGFIRRFVDTARHEPDRIYARFDGAPLSFGRLDAASDAVLARLRARGIAPGDRVAVMLRNSAATLALLHAIAKAGAAWVPVNVALRGDGLRYILSHAEPALSVIEGDLLEQVEQCGVSLPAESIVVSGTPDGLASWLDGERAAAGELPGPEDVFAIMYTSGTTGRPKGVMVSHRMLRLAGEAAVLVSVARDGDVFFMWEPLYHIGGAQMIVLPTLRRVVLAMVSRFSASRFWEQVRHENATHIHFLGGILQILLKQPPGALDRSHGARIAWGGGCPPDIWRPFEERFAMPIRECYGMTECSSFTTFNDDGTVGSVGKPLPWFTVSTLGADGRPVAAGERGEIVVRPVIPTAVTRGYFRNPEATAQALRGGAFHTGDIGSFDDAGRLTFHGRMSDSVRCRGENVSAFEVEPVAAGYPGVEDCAMIGVAAEIGEQEIKLFVQPKPGAAVELRELSAWLGARLAPYQTPRYLAVIAEFERTPSQRIMKHLLPKDVTGCFDRLSSDAKGKRTC